MSRRQIGRHLEQVANRFQDEVAQRPELAWARPDDDEEDNDDEGSKGSDSSEVSMCDLESGSESSDTEFELDDDGDARDDLPAPGRGSGPPDEPPAPEPAVAFNHADLPEDMPRVRPLRAPRSSSIAAARVPRVFVFSSLLVLYLVHSVNLLSIG